MMAAMAEHDLFVAVQTPVLGTGQALRVATILRALAATGPGVHVLYVPFGGEAPAQQLPRSRRSRSRPSRRRAACGAL